MLRKRFFKILLSYHGHVAGDRVDGVDLGLERTADTRLSFHLLNRILGGCDEAVMVVKGLTVNHSIFNNLDSFDFVVTVIRF